MFYLFPKSRGVVCFQLMAKLMDDQIVLKLGGEHIASPVERDIAAGGAAAPTALLVSDKEALERDPCFPGSFPGPLVKGFVCLLFHCRS